MSIAKETVKPNFFIIGAVKCGTSSLHQYLSKHPDIFLPPQKEIDFYAPKVLEGPPSEEDYFKLFEQGRQRTAIGDCSPNYLTCPESPELIAASLGTDIKLIAILRNPVTVMHSHWAYCVQRCLEKRKCATALLESLHAEWNPAKWYLHHGARVRYAEQLERYHKIFSGDNIKVYIFEEFFGNNLPLLSDMLRFLNVSEQLCVENVPHNKGIHYKSIFVHRLTNLYSYNIVPQLIKTLVPHGLKKSMLTHLSNWNTVSTPNAIPEQLAKNIQQGLTPGVRHLEQLLGRDLSTLWF